MEPFSVDLSPATELPPPPIPPAYLPQTSAFAPPPPQQYSSITNPVQHPTYTDMITAAITALKEPNGSSKKAIAKYIETSYSNLPGNHAALLTHHLKRLKNAGQLVMVKHSYMLSRSVPFSSAAAAPSSPPPVAAASADANGGAFPSAGSKRKPGRPPKSKVQTQPNGAEAVFASLGLDDGPSPGSKRGPGRPPKSKTAPAAGVEGGAPQLSPNPLPVEPLDQWNPNQASDQLKVAPSSEPSDQNALTVPVGNDRPKRKPGRPRRLGPPVGSPAVTRPASKGTGKPRGRPPRKAMAVGEAGNLVSVGVGAGLLGKRRGRKPRAAGVKKPRKFTGKPMGRPRKNALAAGAFAAGTHQLVAYEDLKSKLENFNASFVGIQAAATEQLLAYGDLKSKVENFQSKVLQTIGVVKPHLSHESASVALAALQALEALATTDLTAPGNVPSNIPSQGAPIN